MIDKGDKLPVTRQCDLLDLCRSSRCRRRTLAYAVPTREEERTQHRDYYCEADNFECQSVSDRVPLPITVQSILVAFHP